MTLTSEMLKQHNVLKARAEAKLEAKKAAKSIFEVELAAKLEQEFGMPEDAYETLRKEIRELVTSAEDKEIVVEGVGKASIYQRSGGFDVTDPAAVAEWLIKEEKTDVFKFNVKELNVILNGLSAARLKLPGGTTEKFTEVLEVRLSA